MNDSEWAWAAGLFEGEGTILVPGEKPERRIALGMCDLDVVERFRDVVGAGHIHKTPRKEDKPQHRDYWVWHLGAWIEAKRILETMLPHFGERRRARAEEFLATPPVGDNYRKDTCKRGHPLSGDNLKVDPPTTNRPSGRRRCRACARLYDSKRQTRTTSP